MKNRFTSLDEEGFSTAGGDDKFRTPQTLQPALEVLVRKKRCAWEQGEEIVTHQQVGNPLFVSLEGSYTKQGTRESSFPKVLQSGLCFKP